jgi:hypothetical protein
MRSGYARSCTPHWRGCRRAGGYSPAAAAHPAGAPGAELRRVVEEWNTTDAEYPREAASTRSSRQQAERTPGATAAVFGDGLAHLRAAERAGQPAGAPPPRAGRGPERGWRSARSAAWRWSSGCWPSSRPAAPTCRWTRLPRGAPGVHAPGQRSGAAADAGPPACALRPGGAAGALDGRGHRMWTAEPEGNPERESLRRSTWRTSSTPRAPRACPRE